jgi:hypothetical protein
VICGCGKPTAGGSIREVRLLCDGREWEQIGSRLRAAVQTPIHTVEPETVFSLVRVAARDFQSERLAANIFLVAALDSPDSVGQILRKLLPTETQEAVRRGEELLFAERDLWAAEQQVTILTAPDLASLDDFVGRGGAFVFETLYKRLVSRAVERAYFRGGNEGLRDSLAEQYGWSLLLPRPWEMVAPEEESAVYFFKNEPFRHLMVYWEAADPAPMAPDSCLALRERLVWRHYDEDQVDRDRTTAEASTFQGRPCVKLSGVWQNEKHVTGGAFRSYCFECPAQKRLYLVDLNVFAPGKEKFPYLAQLEGIAASFSCQAERQ